MSLTSGNEDLLPIDQKMLLFLVDGKKEPSLPSSSTDYYSIVGTFSGAFKLTCDGSALREKLQDSHKVDEILNIVKSLTTGSLWPVIIRRDLQI